MYKYIDTRESLCCAGSLQISGLLGVRMLQNVELHHRFHLIKMCLLNPTPLRCLHLSGAQHLSNAVEGNDQHRFHTGDGTRLAISNAQFLENAIFCSICDLVCANVCFGVWKVWCLTALSPHSFLHVCFFPPLSTAGEVIIAEKCPWL